MPSVSAMSRYDRRASAIHEAGHAVAALELGSSTVTMTLRRNVAIDLLVDKLWAGQMIYSGFQGLSRAVVGISGLVAESMLGDDGDFNAEQFLEWLDLGAVELSATDEAAFMALHSSWRERAVTRAIDILRQRWPEVQELADQLEVSMEINLTALGWRELKARARLDLQSKKGPRPAKNAAPTTDFDLITEPGRSAR